MLPIVTNGTASTRATCGPSSLGANGRKLAVPTSGTWTTMVASYAASGATCSIASGGVQLEMPFAVSLAPLTTSFGEPSRRLPLHYGIGVSFLILLSGLLSPVCN